MEIWVDFAAIKQSVPLASLLRRYQASSVAVVRISIAGAIRFAAGKAATPAAPAERCWTSSLKQKLHSCLDNPGIASGGDSSEGRVPEARLAERVTAAASA
jgi:hypothetical protein